MTEPDEFLSQPRDHPLGSAVKLRRHALIKRRDLRDS